MSTQTKPAGLGLVAVPLIVGVLAVVFDSTIVSIALPTLARDLNTTIDTIQWVSTSYLLALAVTVPVAGWAQSKIGGKRLWMLALLAFLVGSVLCSLAWDPASLIAFRVIQGLGGGVMLPLLTTIAVQASGGQSLGRMAATLGLPVVLGPILGPVIGGVILGSFDWPWLFWVNVPFCVVGLVLAAIMLPRDEPRPGARFDVVGFVLLSPALVGILYGLSNAARDGGFARADVWLPLALGVALFIGFAAWARRRKGSALVDVGLFRHRPLTTASVLLVLSGFALYGAMLLLPLYYQVVRGSDVLTAGLLLIPQGVGSLVSRTTAGRLADRFGGRWVSVTGFLIIGAATVPFAFADGSTNQWWLAAALFVRGIGLGATTIPLMSVAFLGLEKTEVPHASIITRIATQVGGAFGVAVLAVILQAMGGRAGTAAEVASAFDAAFWWAIGFAGLAVALSFLLPGRPLSARPDATALLEKVDEA